jgi:hypothetical protein
MRSGAKSMTRTHPSCKHAFAAQVVERLYREVRAAAIPGGSEEILLDFAMRQVAGKAKNIMSKL